MKYISKNENDTQDIARKLAEKIDKSSIFYLKGDLGAGKTVFARSFIRHLCENDTLEVPSPTFSLVQTYELKNMTIWHFDLYRIEEEEEIYELGWEEALTDNNIAIIEWPDRLGALAPPYGLEISFKTSENNENQRTITVKEHSAKE